MPLSLIKLEKLLASKGFACKNYFTLDEYCIYIEVFSVTSADSFLLYISGRYELKIENPKLENVYKLKYLENDNEGNIILPENESNEDVDVEEFYTNLEVDLHQNGNFDDMEETLKENYHKSISLKDLSKEDKKNLKDIYKQLNRFLFCVQNLKYKFSIVLGNYLCSITKDNDIDLFQIHNFVKGKSDNRRLYIYIDLKTLYVSLDGINNDLKTVKDSIYSLLDKNQIKHTKILSTLLEQKITILQYSENIINKKQKIDELITKFEILLNDLNVSQQNVYEKLQQLEIKYSTYGIRGLQDDIEKSHLISIYEKEINDINVTKDEIILNIISLREQKENITLKMDKILFDNTIMINEITKNFNKLSELINA
jgi:hypothetical protein